MKNSSLKLSILLVLIATALWFSGSWWYYTCKVKKLCDSKTITQSEKMELTTPTTAINDPQKVTTNVIDSDNDGLSDEEENKIGTDILLSDTDNDSIPDNEEVGTNLFNPLDSDKDGIIDALDLDDDNDGLSTLIEEKIGTSSLLEDTDGDGIKDIDEVGTNTNKPLDSDGDGTINALDTDDDDDNLDTATELMLGTNPSLADSDGDGLSDAIEIGDLMDEPLDSDTDGTIDALDTEKSSDQDGDGLSDALEAQLNTDPTKIDTDGDGIDDAKEIGDNTNQPLDKDIDGIIDALDMVDDSDTDNDGLTDAQEAKLASNPEKEDSDEDGINDNEEIGNNIDDPLDSDSDGILNLNDADDDNDGLPTKYEIEIGTNPITNDTDADGLSDKDELGQGDDKLIDTDADGKINAVDNDDDNDGLTTSIERSLGLDPLSNDSDMDGILDSVEIGQDPKNPTDVDHDGIPDALDTFNDLHYAESQKLAADVQKIISEENDSNRNNTQKKSVTNANTDNVPATDSGGIKADDKSNEKSDAISEPSDADKLTVEAIVEQRSDAFQPSRLYFPSNSANPILTSEASNYFDDVISWMKQSSNNMIMLAGHTDSIGGKQANLAMGIKRVMVIRELLIDKGAPLEQIDIMSRGESEPLFDNTTSIGRLKNRRVEISPIE